MHRTHTCQLGGELTAKRKRFAVSHCPSKRQSALCPGVRGAFFHARCWAAQVQGCARCPQPLLGCGEAEVREMPLFVLGTCDGAATWVGGRDGGRSCGFARSGIEMTNGSRWEPCRPSCRIVYLSGE